MNKGGYKAKASGMKFSGDQLDFLRRRTSPFLDNIGLDRPLTTIVQEVYLQGIADATDIFEERLARCQISTSQVSSSRSQFWA